MKEIQKLSEDVCVLTQISDLTLTLQCPRTSLEEIVKDMLSNVNKQLAERQTSDSQLSYLELMLNTQFVYRISFFFLFLPLFKNFVQKKFVSVLIRHGMENVSVVFTKPEKRSSWEESFNDCKQKLGKIFIFSFSPRLSRRGIVCLIIFRFRFLLPALSADRKPSPEFMASVPIRKTRAGLQFTCAAPTLGLNAFNLRDVWVCNSDGYVGQVCVLSLQPEPTVTSCNGVCNARLLCIASIPAGVTK